MKFQEDERDGESTRYGEVGPMSITNSGIYDSESVRRESAIRLLGVENHHLALFLIRPRLGDRFIFARIADYVYWLPKQCFPVPVLVSRLIPVIWRKVMHPH